MTGLKVAWSLAIAAAVAVAAVSVLSSRDYQWTLPEGVPLPVVPADNPMSNTKVELGRHLFYERGLSVTGRTSCATCHIQLLAFTDGRGRSTGATGETHPRGAMTLVNVAYAGRLTWANHLLDTLEVQALTPIFGEQPIEMGMAGREEDIIQALRDDEYYAKAFRAAFPGDQDPLSILNVVRALASFVRTIVSFDSPYDRYLRGDNGALGPEQVRGMELFFSERLECFHCHGGFNFTDSSTHANSLVQSVGFHNNGLYNIDASGGYPSDNTGLYELTGERRDMGRFKAPSLRNIAVTAPYMHDGSIETLPEVLEHYARGGRVITDGPYAGDGSRNPYRSEFVRGFELTTEERADLLAFLESLTDQSVLSNAAWSDPATD
ncbi:MAG TPA: di-heme enzyme [Woeseiaceae bacterium]|nr:di-heme enzyme [Woeseiaceae bacterium]